MRSHLLLVRFGPFQRDSLVYGLFAAVGMRLDVRVTITGRERAADGFGGERANFFVVTDAGGFLEGHGGWMGRIGTSGDAFGY